MDCLTGPYTAVIGVQTIYTGMFLLSKVAFDLGMNTFIFVFYRQAAATLFLAPIVFFTEWKSAPPLTFKILIKIFVLSLFGITLSLNIYGVGLVYTSATLAAAITNSLPVITFLIAALFSMEKVNLKTIPGAVKIGGIGLCAGGAATIALYKGPFLKLLLHHHLFSHYSPKHHALVHASSEMWVKGVLLLLLANTFWGMWIVFQGIIVTGLTYYLQSWVIEKKGPVFLAMSTPLGFVFTIIASALLLGEIISLGSILGGVLLVGGLYCVLWGKSREQVTGIYQGSICKAVEVESSVKVLTQSEGSLKNTTNVHPSSPCVTIV
ncbi:WAT1-related protein At5g64700 isoform X2 [Apium graveolens]|uniref:WAT1-related protein At5g64700 isoform X2 n=1 Tax=Apium graveolens TaxID=4045 RepID=UPI003D7C0AC4